MSCYDFKTMSSCANFPSSPGFTNTQYCVRYDPYEPGCLWITSDSGEIKNFDAYTGRPGCGKLPYGTIGLAPVSENCLRNITKFLDLTVYSPLNGTYQSATVNVTSSLLGKVVLSQPLANGKLSLSSLNPALIGSEVSLQTSFLNFKCESGAANTCNFNATLTYQMTGVTCCDGLNCFNPPV